MPFVTVLTNFSRTHLPDKFMPLFINNLATVLNKDIKLMKWILETDKIMSLGPDNENDKFMLVKIESLEIFKSQENCEKLIPQIFEYLTKETKLEKSQIITQFYNLEKKQIGGNGECFTKLKL